MSGYGMDENLSDALDRASQMKSNFGIDSQQRLENYIWYWRSNIHTTSMVVISFVISSISPKNLSFLLISYMYFYYNEAIILTCSTSWKCLSFVHSDSYLFCRTNGTMAKETSVKETTPAVPPPETKPSPPTTLFGKFYPIDPHVPRVCSQSPPPTPQCFRTIISYVPRGRASGFPGC